MSKSTIRQQGAGMKSQTTPENFELEEIKWEKPEYQIHSGFIPFENTTKKILEELKQ